MKTARLSLVIALAALGLQACDINVKPSETQVTAPQSSLPDDTVLNAPPTTTVAAPDVQQPAAPVDATPTPVVSTDAPVVSTDAPAATPMPDATPVPGAPVDANAAPVETPPAVPGTNAMGAQPGAAQPAVPDGVAAPTELARFLEQNVIKPKTP